MCGKNINNIVTKYRLFDIGLYSVRWCFYNEFLNKFSFKNELFTDYTVWFRKNYAC